MSYWDDIAWRGPAPVPSAVGVDKPMDWDRVRASVAKMKTDNQLWKLNLARRLNRAKSAHLRRSGGQL